MKRTACMFVMGMTICGSISVAASFQGLGTPSGTDSYSRAFQISGDGKTVVGYSSAYEYPGDSERKAFRWTKETGIVTIVPPYSYAEGVSANGSCVAGSRGGYGTTGFVWTQTGGVQSVGDLPGGSVFSLARDVSDNGQYVVGISEAYPEVPGYRTSKAYRWSQQTGMVALGNGDAFGVSADGSVVVGKTANSTAFRWTQAGGMQDLGQLPIGGQTATYAMAVSADGSSVVGYTHGTYSGKRATFRWRQETGMVNLGDILGGTLYSEPWDISGDGSVIVGNVNTAIGTRAMIWDESGGMQVLQNALKFDYGLDLTGWNLINATGVSNDGFTITGYGTNPAGLTEAWIVTIPEPYLFVSVDINPGKCPNGLHTNGNGPLQVAICGSAMTDVNDIDVASIEILGVTPTRSVYRDVATAKTAPPEPGECLCDTFGADGIVDLLLRFEKQDIIDALGANSTGYNIELNLTGCLKDGTNIIGWDCVDISSRGKP